MYILDECGLPLKRNQRDNHTSEGEDKEVGRRVHGVVIAHSIEKRAQCKKTSFSHSVKK